MNSRKLPPPSVLMRAVLVTAFLQSAVCAQQANDSWSARVILRDNTPDVLEPGGEFLAPAHASLLPDGRVLIWGFRQPVVSPTPPVSRAYSFAAVIGVEQLSIRPTVQTTLQLQTNEPPVRLDTVQLTPPLTLVSDQIFCGGHAFDADGNLFVAGGLRKVFTTIGNTTYGVSGGLEYAMRWLSGSSSWSNRIDLLALGSKPGEIPMFFEGRERYYPTVTKLADGRMMTTSGVQILEGCVTVSGQPPVCYGGPQSPSPRNLSIETWDPSGMQFELSSDPSASGSALTPPEIFNGDYTHVFVLPTPATIGSESFDVAMFGETGEPVLMSSSTSSTTRWSSVFAQRVAGAAQLPNKGASTLMLPIRLGGEDAFPYAPGTMLCAGGGEMGAHHDQIDVWDPYAQSWNLKANMTARRHHPSTVLMPDGSVVAVAGHDVPGAPTAPLRRADYVDLRNNFSVTAGASQSYTVRGYHTITLLLPDGRILVGGGRSVGSGFVGSDDFMERADFEFLEPPYYSKPRPKLFSAPAEIAYGQEFSITTDRYVREIVLISLGSMTHSVDMNQRYVQVQKVGASLPIFPGDNDGDGEIQRLQNARAPANANVAPPGHYMLFALDSALTPSVAKIVKVRP